MAAVVACVLIASVWLAALFVVTSAAWLMLRPQRWARVAGSTLVLLLILLLPQLAGVGRWFA